MFLVVLLIAVECDLAVPQALLAMYVFAGQELGLAQRCLYRARLLMLLVHGEEHAYMATLDVSMRPSTTIRGSR